MDLLLQGQLNFYEFIKNRTKFKEVKNHRRPGTNYLRQVCLGWFYVNYPLRSWLALLLLGCQVLFKFSPYLSLTLILPVKWKHKMILYDTRMEKICSSQILKSARRCTEQGEYPLSCARKHERNFPVSKISTWARCFLLAFILSLWTHV